MHSSLHQQKCHLEGHREGQREGLKKLLTCTLHWSTMNYPGVNSMRAWMCQPCPSWNNHPTLPHLALPRSLAGKVLEPLMLQTEATYPVYIFYICISESSVTKQTLCPFTQNWALSTEQIRTQHTPRGTFHVWIRVLFVPGFYIC